MAKNVQERLFCLKPLKNVTRLERPLTLRRPSHVTSSEELQVLQKGTTKDLVVHL